MRSFIRIRSGAPLKLGTRLRRWLFGATVRLARATCAVLGHRRPIMHHVEVRLGPPSSASPRAIGVATRNSVAYCARCFQSVPSDDGRP